jgi:hypothetical protein
VTNKIGNFTFSQFKFRLINLLKISSVLPNLPDLFLFLKISTNFC